MATRRNSGGICQGHLSIPHPSTAFPRPLARTLEAYQDRLDVDSLVAGPIHDTVQQPPDGSAPGGTSAPGGRYIPMMIFPAPHLRSGAARALLALAAALTLTACTPTPLDENAVQRGDVAFAQDQWEEALAEYRLAVRQGADDPESLARVAQTYAMMGRVDDAGTYYREAVQVDSTYTDQAVSQLMGLARDARASGDRFAMAMAVETALDLRPGVGVGEIALDLARHYFRAGEYGRALPFYQKAMAEATDSAPDIVFEVGQAYEEIGDCQHALVFFERFREMVRAWERGEVDWYIGTCAFARAREIRADARVGLAEGRREEELERALDLVERTVEVGEPRNIQGRAWFEMGEILSDLGQCQAAMDAYERVRQVEGSGALVDRAQDRYDEIRFGRGLEDLRGGRCR